MNMNARRDEENKRRRDEVGAADASGHFVSPSLRLSVSQSRAFSLTELLIVITVIVIVLALSLPAFNILTGSRSEESAQNQISAMLGRARTEAIGLQETRGVYIYLNPATDRFNVALVRFPQFASYNAGTTYNPGDYVTNSNTYYVCILTTTNAPSDDGVFWCRTDQYAIDITADTDSVKLPPGVGAQMITDSNYITGGTRASDAYLRCGAILFDSAGRVVHTRYSVASGGQLGQQMGLVPAGTNMTFTYNYPVAASPAVLRSQFGLALYQRQALENQSSYSRDDYSVRVYNQTLTSYTSTGEGAEEDWLDKNAIPLMVNRYNGTLIRGE